MAKRKPAKMATYAGPVKRRVKAADLQTDVTDTDNRNQSIKHHGAEISTSIHSLPPELMVMIFSHLDCEDKVNVACLCSHWCDLIDIPSIWRDVCPILHVDELTSEHIKKMRIRMISKVEIYSCHNMENMTRFLQALPHLRNLSFSFLYNLTRFCPQKETFPGIKYLTIYHHNLNTGGLRSLLQPMVNLQHLSLNCFPQQDILCALQHSKHLVSLDITCNRSVVKIVGPSMDGLNPILSLKYLTLENVTVGDSSLDFISRAFPQLHTLNIVLSSDVTCNGLEKLVNLKQLKYLEMGSGNFQHDWMEHLDTKLSQLESLILCGSRRISNKCLQSISKMPVLRVLNVPIQDQEVEGLHALSQGCLGVQILTLACGNQSINQGLHVLKCMPNLQHLILFACSVNDDFWRENSKSFSKLRRLSFIECQLISEQCLPYLSQMACLRRLMLKKCMNLGNKGMKRLCKRRRYNALTCLLLMELEIKDDGLVKLSKHTPFLEELRIVSCNNVTEDGLAKAVSNLSQLKALETDISGGIKDRLNRIRPHLQFYRL